MVAVGMPENVFKLVAQYARFKMWAAFGYQWNLPIGCHGCVKVLAHTFSLHIYTTMHHNCICFYCAPVYDSSILLGCLHMHLYKSHIYIWWVGVACRCMVCTVFISSLMLDWGCMHQAHICALFECWSTSMIMVLYMWVFCHLKLSSKLHSWRPL